MLDWRRRWLGVGRIKHLLLGVATHDDRSPDS